MPFFFLQTVIYIHSFLFVPLHTKNLAFGDGEIVHWLGELAALLDHVGTQHLHGDSKLPITPVSWGPIPSSGIHGHQACTCCMYIHIGPYVYI